MPRKQANMVDAIQHSGLQVALDTDIVIPVMGQTKAGKSSLINDLLEDETKHMEVGHKMTSCTSTIRAVAIDQAPEGYYALNRALAGRRIVLVDTPGFDDTHMNDDAALIGISQWLEKSYRKGMLVAGALYIHDINQHAWGGTAKSNLKLFHKLCGDDAMSRVSLVTTKWGKLRNVDDGVTRVGELADEHWSSMIEQGASLYHLFPSDSDTPKLDIEGARDSPWDIIHNIVVCMKARDVANHILLIQKELVHDKRLLGECEAGKELRLSLKKLLDHAKGLQKAAKEDAKSPDSRARLEERQREVQRLVEQLENLKPALSNRLKRWVKGAFRWGS